MDGRPRPWIDKHFSRLPLADRLSKGNPGFSARAHSTLSIKPSLFWIRFLIVFFTFLVFLLEGGQTQALHSPASIAWIFVPWVLIWGLSYFYIDPAKKTATASFLAAEGLLLMGTIFLTGGLNSPFLAAIMSPILATMVYFPYRYSWGFLLFFAATLWYQALNTGMSPSSPAFAHPPAYAAVSMMQNSGPLLFLILTTAISQSLTTLLGRMTRSRNHTGGDAPSLNLHPCCKEALDRVMLARGAQDIAEVLVQCAGRLGPYSAACWLNPQAMQTSGGETFMTIYDDEGLSPPGCWQEELQREYQKMAHSNRRHTSRRLGTMGERENRLLENQGQYFGVLSIIRPLEGEKDSHEDSSLEFLALLGALALERLQLEELRGQVRIQAEQKRIAGEIHDQIAPYWFSVNCALSRMAQRWEEEGAPSGILEHIALIKKTAGQASSELRSVIYDLAPPGPREQPFLELMSRYLEEVGILHAIEARFKSQGSHEQFRSELGPVLFRILKEASTNAIRHGRCTILEATLHLAPRENRLVIEDNGRGCPPEVLFGTGPAGMGIENMKNLARSHQGVFHITGIPGKKTVVEAVFPGRIHPVKRREEMREDEIVTHR